MKVEIINEQWASLDDWTFEIVWKPIPGFPLYEASNIGQIRNAKTKRIRKVHSNSRTNKDTYYLICDVQVNGKRKHMRVHRLVALAFLPNPDNLPQINHKDEDKTNNCVWNLEWCTAEYNVNYGTANERRIKSRNK